MFRDAEDHISWLLQHGWHEKALAAVEAGPDRSELIDEVLLLVVFLLCLVELLLILVIASFLTFCLMPYIYASFMLHLAINYSQYCLRYVYMISCCIIYQMIFH